MLAAKIWRSVQKHGQINDPVYFTSEWPQILHNFSNAHCLKMNMLLKYLLLVYTHSVILVI